MVGDPDPGLVFAIPGDLSTPTGGYAYDRSLLTHLPGCGIRVQHLQLPGQWPSPTAADVEQTRRVLASLRRGTPVMVDGLAFGAFPDTLLEMLGDGTGHPLLALVHHPLAMEAGIAEDERRLLAATERHALARATHVIATSAVTARTLTRDYGVPAGKISIACPGTPPAHRAEGSDGTRGAELLCVGSVSPRKAYGVLALALSQLTDLDWHVTIAGETHRVPGEHARVAAAIEAHGLAGRVTFTGVLTADELAAAYRSSDLFVMPSLYEGYGMALAEAMSYGLPIICTTGGAAAETVPDGAAVKVPPGDAPALGNALRLLLTNPQRLADLGERSWTAGRTLPPWSETAGRVAGAVRAVARLLPERAA
ncbi:glycosyltransferase family 4 protein [Pseudarthrobacter sp. PH31-O2]|uniref:glycosyltransferase family 4 protein n=1 Tax=Pseudarthrobacter sp. PH31-O2 TaxID=3046206 RepID=UPI0024BA4DB6|nr:glycosyltransferase family 4 protein [Pseudarthrobacter sp. PH31-O2]MDJ0351587.1 glycosyltransferase family 4 protein [Pseudarthrobacter sp. PH31-O2]